MERIGLGGLAAVVVWIATAGAMAQPQNAMHSNSRQSRAWGEVTFFTDSDESGGASSSITVMTILGEMKYFLSPDLALEVRWPVINHVAASVDIPGVGSMSDSTTKVGNAFGGIFWHGGDATTTFRAGGGATLPIAWGESDVVALYYSAATHGLMDFWLWAPETLSFVGSGSIEYASGVVAGGEADFAMIMDIGDAFDESEPVFQARGWVGGEFGQGSRAGAALAVVVLLDGEDDDDAQVSLEPFVEISLGSGFLLARLLLNLDDPLGFALDEEGVWGLTLGGGGSW